MAAPAATDLVALWDRACGLGPVDRALVLAQAVGGDPEQLLDQPVGVTHGLLLELRERLAGPRMEATAGCPRCDQVVELVLDAHELRALGASEPVPEPVPEPLPQPATTVGTPGSSPYVVRGHPPTPGDLIAVAGAADAVTALRGRCLSVTSEAGEPLGIDVLGEEQLAASEQRLAAADPLSEILLGTTCPSCGTGFEAEVDVAAFVWAEVEAAAHRLLQEVDVLARAYGWTEAEVLGLSPTRRAAYLRLVLDGAP